MSSHNFMKVISDGCYRQQIRNPSPEHSKNANQLRIIVPIIKAIYTKYQSEKFHVSEP